MERKYSRLKIDEDIFTTILEEKLPTWEIISLEGESKTIIHMVRFVFIRLLEKS